MKKINLKGISEILNEKEMKNVMGGSAWDLPKTSDGICYWAASGCIAVTMLDPNNGTYCMVGNNGGACFATNGYYGNCSCSPAEGIPVIK